jgi:putative ABC transport system permease protein
VLARSFPQSESLSLNLQQGDPEKVHRQLAAGQVVLGNVLAHRLNKRIGDEVELATTGGTRKFKIAGVSEEYAVGGMVLVMDLGIARRQLGLEGADALIIHAAPDKRTSLRTALSKIAEDNGLILQSVVEFREETNRLLLTVQASLIGLLVVGLMTTSIGIVNCLAMNVLEQAREFGLLRAIGMTERQLRRTVLSQALLIALVSVLLGTPLGLAISYAVDAAALPVLGRAVKFAVYPSFALGITLAALVVVWFAALLPARRVRQLAPLDALRYE